MCALQIVDKQKMHLGENIRAFVEKCETGQKCDISVNAGRKRFMVLKCESVDSTSIMLSIRLLGASWGNESLPFFANIFDRVLRGNPMFTTWLVYKPDGGMLYFCMIKDEGYYQQLKIL